MTEQEYEQLSRKTEEMLPYPKPDGVEAANKNNCCYTLKYFWLNNLNLKSEVEAKAREEIQTPELKEWWDDFNSRYPVKERPTLFERVPGLKQAWGTDLEGNVTNPEIANHKSDH